MRIKAERAVELFKEFNIYSNEICDTCRKLLGNLRWTRHGDRNGAWCSQECRDGAVTVKAANALRENRKRIKMANRARREQEKRALQRTENMGVTRGV